MEILLNVFQEIFLVSFSILYGIMLQTFFGVNAFPWSKIRKNSEETTGLKNEKIVLIRRKLVASIIILNIIPFLYALLILWLLSYFRYENWNCYCYPLIFQAFTAGLAVFGFQRWYGILAISRKKYFPKIYGKLKKQLRSDIVEQKEFEGASYRQPEKSSYKYSTIYYIIIPIFSLLLSIYKNPWWGLSAWVISLIVILYWLYYK